MSNLVEPSKVAEVLQNRFAIQHPKALQLQIIQAVVDGKSILAALPTGWGKSMLFLASGLIRNGLAVVISPTIALMTDQVRTLAGQGITARTLNSHTLDEERQEIWELLEARALKFLFISPQALEGSWADRLRNYSVSVFGIDEAHIIVDWGMGGLNKSYIAAYATLRSRFPEVPIVATTGTATSETISLIQKALNFGPGELVIARETADRPDIKFSVMQVDSRENALNVITQQVRAFTDQFWKKDKLSGVVFTVTQRDAERLAARLTTTLGMQVPAFTSSLSAENPELAEVIMDGLQDQIYPLVVTTSALGQGINVGRLRWVIHDGMRLTLEDYWQQVGRIGRDGERMAGSSHAILIGSKQLDSDRWAWAYQNIPYASRQLFERRIELSFNYYSWPLCRRSYLVGYLSDSNGPRCAGCDVCEVKSLRSWSQDEGVIAQTQIHESIRLSAAKEFTFKKNRAEQWVDHKLYGPGLVISQIGEMITIFCQDGEQRVSANNVRSLKFIAQVKLSGQDQGDHTHGTRWISTPPVIGASVCVNRELDGVVEESKGIALRVRDASGNEFLAPSALCWNLSQDSVGNSNEPATKRYAKNTTLRSSQDEDWRNDR